jgi:hypothetical protein
MSDVEKLAKLAVDCGFRIHRDLGPGLLESVYERLLAAKLDSASASASPPPGGDAMLSPILVATLVAGTLDILSAFLFAGMSGVKPLGVLRFVASGPFGAAASPSPGWAAVGLAVHFSIMACMAAAYMLVASRIPALLRHPILAGLAYGLLLWLVMYWIVLPLRFAMPSPDTLWGIGNALFSHCLLVGIPVALVARRYFAGPEAARA